MSYVSVTSAQLKALQELDKGEGLRIHGWDGKAERVDVFLDDHSTFRAYDVSYEGYVEESAR